MNKELTKNKIEERRALIRLRKEKITNKITQAGGIIKEKMKGKQHFFWGIVDWAYSFSEISGIN